jgi:GT2 family glycosyltransferase
MHAANKTIDAVVITWNKYEMSLDCIEHLAASSVPVNLYDVDNGSSDETPRRVRERFPNVTVVELPENLGYPGAANQGFANSSSEFVAIINSDANVEPDYFEKVLRCFDDPKVGFAAGLSMDPASGLVDAAGAKIDRGLSWLPYMQGVPAESVSAVDSELAAPPFDAIVFRRAAIESVGGYDEDFFAYSEDVDITLRLRAAGWKIDVATDAKVWHIGSASLGKRTVAQLHFAAWGRGYVAGRYRVGPAWLLTDIAAGLVDSIQLRSWTPISRRWVGWRQGRALPAREVPTDLHYESWSSSLKRRVAAR